MSVPTQQQAREALDHLWRNNPKRAYESFTELRAFIDAHPDRPTTPEGSETK
jgi:hypothetical protein